MEGGKFNGFKFKALATRGKNMSLVKDKEDVYLTCISTEGDIKVYEISGLLDKLSKTNGVENFVDLQDNFECIYSIKIESRLLVVGTELSWVKDKGEIVENGTEKVEAKPEESLEKNSNGVSTSSKRSFKKYDKRDLNQRVKKQNFMKSWIRMLWLNKTNGFMRLTKWRRWHRREVDLSKSLT